MAMNRQKMSPGHDGSLYKKEKINPLGGCLADPGAECGLIIALYWT